MAYPNNLVEYMGMGLVNEELTIPPHEYLADLRTRDLVWAFYYMIYDGAIFPENLELTGDTILKFMADFVMSKSNFGYVLEAENGVPIDFKWKEHSTGVRLYPQLRYLQKMDADKSKMMLNDREFDWIGNDLRQLYWVHSQVMRNCAGWLILPQNPLRLPIRDFTIAILDAFRRQKADKAIFLANLKQQWAEIISKNTLLNWIKPTDKELRKWVYKYIEKQGITSPDVVREGVIKDEHLALIVTLDTAFTDLAKKELFIKKMSHAWRQQKYRLNNKDKKQFNFWLEQESDKKLEYAARELGFPKNVLLDNLIDKEYRRLLARKSVKRR